MLTLMASPKIKMINVRLAPNVHDDFKIACELRGASMSSLMHQFIFRTIREEREASPHAFKQAPMGILSTNIKLTKHDAAKLKPDKKINK